MIKFDNRVFSCVFGMLLLIFVGCGRSASYNAGSYTAESAGKNGPVKVEVTFSASKITGVKIISHSETPGISDPALKKIPESILAAQSVSVDTVTGATLTSTAILTAVKDCIRQAGGAEVQKSKSSIEKTKKKTVTENCDIVVAGAGAAGATAALAAAKAGAKVILLEKTALPMGASTFAGGMFAADSSLQKKAGKTVSKEWLYDEYMDSSHGYMNSLLVRKIIDESGKTVDFLLDNGVRLNLVDAGTGGSYVHIGMPATLHGYADGGTVAVTTVIDGVKQAGGTVLFSTPATDILVDRSGAVTGLTAESSDTCYEIHSQKVIIATGGFGGSETMMRKYYGKNFTYGEIKTNTGDGITMAWKAGAGEQGADTTQYFWETWTQNEFGELAQKVGDAFFSLTDFTFSPHLRVNKFGQRFCNETDVTDYAVHGAEIAMQPGAMEWLILDTATLSRLASKGYISFENHYGKWKNSRQTFMEFNEPNDTDALHKAECSPVDYRPLLDAADGTGVVVKADTLDRLASLMGADAAALRQSVDAYNAAVKTGKDPEFFAKLSHMQSLVEGPYYAVKFVARNLGTLGGIRVNENMQAVSDDGAVISGLYAAGADAGGMYGKTYVDFEGGTLGFAYISGRLAGLNAAQTLKK